MRKEILLQRRKINIFDFLRTPWKIYPKKKSVNQSWNKSLNKRQEWIDSE